MMQLSESGSKCDMDFDDQQPVLASNLWLSGHCN